MKVDSIVKQFAKRGVGKKGEWSQAIVKLEDGQEVWIFNPIKVGDEVESYENNGYTNWKVVIDTAEELKDAVEDSESVSEPLNDEGLTDNEFKREVVRLLKKLAGEADESV